MGVKGLIFLILFTVLSKGVYADIILNEIFPDPIADESLNEWIEIHNNGTSEINVSGWIIGDNQDNDTLEGGLYYKGGTVIPAKGFAIITDESTRVYNNFNVSDEAIRLYVDDSSIGNGLSNTGESIFLYNSSNLIDNVTYSAVAEGNSFSFNEGWQETIPTPGSLNNGTTDDTCDWKIEYILNGTVFTKDEFEFKVRATKIKGEKTNISGAAWIEDSNNNLEKEYVPWTNETVTSQRTSSTYSPNLRESIYILNTNLTTECIDTNQDNNFEQQLITIKKSGFQDSELEILNVLDLGSDKNAEFGQIIRVRLRVYKGNTTKEQVKIWVEEEDKVSKIASVNFMEKFTEYETTIPVQIKPNCDKKFEEGKHDVKVSGLGTSTDDTIKIIDDDNLCPKTTTTKTQKYVYELEEYAPVILSNEETNLKVKIENNDANQHNFHVWSYIFRGPKSYSGEREANRQSVSVDKESSETVNLKNSIEEALPGDYKLKVKIIRDELKTPQEITKDIKIIQNQQLIVQNPKSEESKLTVKEIEQTPTTFNPVLTPELVYESTSFKARQLLPYFIISLLGLVSIVLIWKKIT